MKCFLIMPYGNRDQNPERVEELDALHELIRQAVEGVDAPDGSRLRCVRGDHDTRPGEIIAGIVRELVESEIAIAVLSGHNPNVFYELGVRHALSNSTILMAESEDDVPFDLRTQRMILYSTNTVQATAKMNRDLRAALNGILASPQAGPDNPVRRFLGAGATGVPQTVPEGGKFEELADQIRDLREAVTGLLNERRAPSGPGLLGQVAVAGLSYAGFMASRVHAGHPRRKDIPKELLRFEGIWVEQSSGSHAYSRMTGDGLKVVYCYAGNDRATGAYEDFEGGAGRIFARFRWFEDPGVRGMAMFTVIDDDTLKGGWWLDHSPQKGRISVPAEMTESMVPMVWQRLPHRPWPSWAEDFFSKA